jgi:hypothetical protein
VWKYNHPEGEMTVSIDFPFRGFHALQDCYQATGWELIHYESYENEGDQFHQADLRKPGEQSALVQYALYELSGKTVKSKAKSGLSRFTRFEQSILEPVSMQVQLYFGCAGPVLDELKSELQTCFKQTAKPLSSSLSFLKL